MSKPIGATPVLKGKDAERFLKEMHENENKKVGPTPTPNLWKAVELIKKLSEDADFATPDFLIIPEEK